MTLGFVVEEFYHEDLRSFGGFGKTVKSISDYYNTQKGPFQCKVILTTRVRFVDTPTIRRFHNADVLLLPFGDTDRDPFLGQYRTLLDSLSIDVFVSIDYYPSYNYALTAAPKIPLIVYIRDPRSSDIWRKISAIDLELRERNKETVEELIKLAGQKAAAMKDLMNMTQKSERKVVFATNARCLVDRAKKTYGLHHIKPYALSHPMVLPNVRPAIYSNTPSLCYVGRLAAVKRFWIVLELAKRFPNITFYMLGDSANPELVDSIIGRYMPLRNVRLLGFTTGEEKARILSSCWALINTSVHEGVPVSFLEAFSYGKCVISCQNPDGLVEKYGYYTGEILGEGLDEGTYNKFSECIQALLQNSEDRITKGTAARRYVKQHHSYAAFERQFTKILREEQII
ncbi:MAG: glycosyltransferase family 4 protein [Deltaproteobacteria bacterium]|nr:glycosyltransferase family 4 protein [Deltaproteobacteria bacterium]